MKYFTPLLVVLLTRCIQPQYDPEATIEKNLRVLASDSLMGRAIGTKGESMAAAYIVEGFKDREITAKGTDGYYQPFFVKKDNMPHTNLKENPEKEGINGFNVLGMIDNPGEEIVIVGAHYDHLGMGDFSSLHKGGPEVHNGADDNASGVVAMLHLATLLKQKKLKRDLLFIAFSGEEKGLWGSSYFVKNPTIDLDKVNFMINMDMVGRLDEERGLAINGTGTSPAWNQLIMESNKDTLKLVLNESGVGPSDHTSFYLHDIPVLHFFTGQHEDYHRPSDDIEKINIDGIIKVASMIEQLILTTDEKEQLVFTKTKESPDNAPRFSVVLGVVPDYLYDGRGMRIDGINHEGQAQRAGLKKGDIVVQLGDSSITDLMSYMSALSGFTKGDTTEVKIKREDEELTFPIEF